MNGLIIVEGPDCTGKTTLCNYLMRTCLPQPVYLHATYPYEGTDDVRVYHLNLLERAIRLSEKTLVILDRLWPSELIYGTIYRGGPQYPGYELELDKLIKQAAGIYVFTMYGPRAEYLAFAEAQQRGGRKELYVEKMGLTYDAYRALSEKMLATRPEDTLIYEFASRGFGAEEYFVQTVLIKTLIARRTAQPPAARL